MIKKYEDIIIETSTKNFLTSDEKNDFVGTVDWGARKSGVVLRATLSNPIRINENLDTTFESQFFEKSTFLEWIKTIGNVVVEKESGQSLLKIPTSIDSGIPFNYQMSHTGETVVTFEFRSESERSELLPLLQDVLRKTMAALSKVFVENGVANPVGWELVWMSLANKAILIKWFVTETDIDRPYSVDQLLNKLSDNYPSLGASTKKDGITSLKESISRSPLGGDSGVAICEYNGKIFKSITRKAKDVHPLTILYGLYLIAELSGRNSFTVRELLTADVDSIFVSPMVAFGIAPDTFKRQCEGLRTRYPDYISTTFTHGNDGLDVYPEKYALEDIVNLTLEELQ